jgi:hypothetical protein
MEGPGTTSDTRKTIGQTGLFPVGRANPGPLYCRRWKKHNQCKPHFIRSDKNDKIVTLKDTSMTLLRHGAG